MYLQQALNGFDKAYFCVLNPSKPVLLDLRGKESSNFQKDAQRPNTASTSIDWYYFWPSLAFARQSLYSDLRNIMYT